MLGIVHQIGNFEFLILGIIGSGQSQERANGWREVCSGKQAALKEG